MGAHVTSMLKPPIPPPTGSGGPGRRGQGVAPHRSMQGGTSRGERVAGGAARTNGVWGSAAGETRREVWRLNLATLRGTILPALALAGPHARRVDGGFW
jgi:hypothetical protein